ncbi:MAG: asparagine--tRNA ligase [Planctomycetota bacterium]
MKRTEIVKVLDAGKPGDRVTVAGWIKTLRISKNVAFLHLNDGSCFDSLQVVLEPALANFKEVTTQITGASLLVQGELRASPAAGQRVEVVPSAITILGTCDASSPVQKAGTSFEFLRTVAHMRPRTNTFGAMFRVRSVLAAAVHAFFGERGFVYCHSPILTTSDCEGAGAMFQVTMLDMNDPPRTGDRRIDYTKDFFGEKCHLTVSGQLEAEILAMSLGKAYTFGPTFRAENSNTPRHASEFWMVEPEMAFADLDDDMALAEDFVRFLLRYVLEHSARDLKFFDERIEKGLIAKMKTLADAKFSTMTYTDVMNVLQKCGRKFEFPPVWGGDIQTEHERFLTEEHAKGPVFVTHMPRKMKPFYMYCDDGGKTVSCFDLLVPRVGELIGGSQREHRLDVLQERMRELNMDPKPYEWYADLRRFGTAPHAGFGLGFERVLMYVTGMENIRDVALCPRVPGYAKF